MRKWFVAVLASSLVVFSAIVYFAKKSEITESANLNLGCSSSNLSGEIDTWDNVAFFEGYPIAIPEVALAQVKTSVLGVARQERWIEIDLSEQKLKAWEGDKLFLESPVSTGLPWWPTPEGEFRIWIKLRATKMEGGEGKYYYYLPNVPFVMFFGNDRIPGWKGYGLHGTYWHNDFGTPRSHGCVNLPIDVAKQLYYWVDPGFLQSKWTARASENNPGTRIVIHQ